MHQAREQTTDYRRDLDAVAGHLRRANRVLVVTGAGISADSGLPTYRGIGGLYNDRPTDDDIPIEVALSGDMLRMKPGLTWKYIHQIESACRGACHNRAHEVIAALQKKFESVWVLTQNIDGFHRDAGSDQVIEIHGNYHELTCTHCSHEEQVADYTALEIPPYCSCGSLIRPRIVLFGEMLPDAAMDQMFGAYREGFDIVFSIGTTSVFPYIAAPVLEARRAGVPTVEINPGETEVSRIVDYRLKARAVEVMEALWQRL